MEETLPRACLDKVVNGANTKKLKISTEFRELILRSSIEFINMVSSEANEELAKRNEKLMSAPHLIAALKTLGFDKYLDQVEAEAKALVDVKQEKSSKKRKKKKEAPSQEELIEMQKMMFAAARSRLSGGGGGGTHTHTNTNTAPKDTS